LALVGFHCKQCGKCCKLRGAYQNYATDDDYNRWLLEGREDILQYVAVNDCGLSRSNQERRLLNVWVKPGTEEYLDECPWLKKLPEQDLYICAIHHTKPWHCRSFPSDRGFAERVGCPACSDSE
jgi:Fe-S-cluster containining protein